LNAGELGGIVCPGGPDGEVGPGDQFAEGAGFFESPYGREAAAKEAVDLGVAGCRQGGAKLFRKGNVGHWFWLAAFIASKRLAM